MRLDIIVDLNSSALSVEREFDAVFELQTKALADVFTKILDRLDGVAWTDEDHRYVTSPLWDGTVKDLNGNTVASFEVKS